MTVQKSICKISDNCEQQLFIGFDRMRDLDRVLFVFNKVNLEIARVAIPVIRNVLCDIAINESYEIIGELDNESIMQSINKEQEEDNNYLDSLNGSHNLHRYTDMNMVSKKRKTSGETEEDIDSSGSMSALTSAGVFSSNMGRSPFGREFQGDRGKQANGRGRGGRRLHFPPRVQPVPTIQPKKQ